MQTGRRNRHRRTLSPLRFLAVFLVTGALLAPALLTSAALAPAAAREPRGKIAALLRAPAALRIAVIGDSVAGDLARGMQKLLHPQSKHKVVKFTKAATGLMRDDVYDWRGALRGFVGKREFDVAIVMIGGNDRQSIFLNGTRLRLGSAAWRAEYARRVAAFMAILAKAEAKVYWVGLPPVSSARMNADYRMLNAIYRAQAGKHGFAYLDLWARFTDAKGRYTSFGRAADGTKRRLRQRDGKHFTIYGEMLLADLVARTVARDLDEIKPAH